MEFDKLKVEELNAQELVNIDGGQSEFSLAFLDYLGGFGRGWVEFARGGRAGSSTYGGVFYK